MSSEIRGPVQQNKHIDFAYGDDGANPSEAPFARTDTRQPRKFENVTCPREIIHF